MGPSWACVGLQNAARTWFLPEALPLLHGICTCGKGVQGLEALPPLFSLSACEKVSGIDAMGTKVSDRAVHGP